MEAFFTDPNEIPLPPEEVRLRRLQAEPWLDRQRVRIKLEIDPFQQRPNADLSITNALGDEVARANILEPFDRILEVNLHLREANPGGEYQVVAVLYYQKTPLENEQESTAVLPEPQIVDRKQISFTIPTIS